MQDFDPSLPSYQHPNYVVMQEPLEVLLHCYDNLERVKSVYLPREEKEPKKAHEQRVAIAEFNNKLRPLIESNVGLLSAFEIENEPPTLEAYEDDVDGCGSDYKTFFQECDRISLRDDYCYVLVDYPAASQEIVTEADRILARRRPYLKLIDRRNVLNWRTHYENGKQVVDSVTIMVETIEPDGAFGVKRSPRYHQFVRDASGLVQHIIWRIDDEFGKQNAVVEGRSTLSVSEIPLVCYPYPDSAFKTEVPPLLKLARLNIKLFRLDSMLFEIQRRVNSPTVYRKHPTQQVPDNLPAVVFGASWVIEVPNGGDVGVLEIAGTGVDRLENSIQSLLKEIDAESSGFLAGSKVERTATEAFLSSAQVQASLNGRARAKANAIKRIFDYWCGYTKELNNIEVKMDHSILEQPLDAQEMAQLVALWEKGAIAHKTLLELLKMGRQLPPDFDVEYELESLRKEMAEQAAAQKIAVPGMIEGSLMQPDSGDTEDGVAGDEQSTDMEARSLQYQ